MSSIAIGVWGQNIAIMITTATAIDDDAPRAAARAASRSRSASSAATVRRRASRRGAGLARRRLGRTS